MPSKGGRANLRGKDFEESVKNRLAEEHQLVSSGRFFAMRHLEQPIYAKQVLAGKNIYGKQRRVDFIVYHPTRWPECLAIQCKWQSSGGSVDEKYPFEVLSIEDNPLDAVIVLDGGGYSDGAKAWLQEQAGKHGYRLRGVFDLGEFTRYLTQRSP